MRLIYSVLVASALCTLLFILTVFGTCFFSGISFDDFIEFSMNISYAPNLIPFKMLLIVQTVAFFGIIPGVFVYFYKKKETFSFMKLNNFGSIKQYFLIMIIMIAALPFINFIAEFNSLIIDTLLGEDNYLKLLYNENEAMTKMLLNTGSVPVMLFNMFIVALLPGVFEEICFRGTIQTALQNLFRNHHLAIISTGILFGLFHFEFYGLIPRTLMGVFFGYLLYWTENLWVPVIAHFTNNAAIVLIDFYIRKGTLSPSVEKIGGDDNTMYWGLISGIVFAIISFIFYRQSAKSTSQD